MIQFQSSLIYNFQKLSNKNVTAVQNKVIIQTTAYRRENQRTSGG